MVTSSKPNFLTSKIGKFSLGRTCLLTPRLPLLFCFLNLLEYTMSRTQSHLNHFSFFPNFTTLLNFSFFSSLTCITQIFPYQQPSTTSHPSFFLLILLTPLIVSLLNVLTLAPGLSEHQQQN